MSTEHTLLVSEEFTAPQGEGPHAGRPMYWLRLGGCNLACKWCDAAYACFYDKRSAAQHETGRVYDPQQELTRYHVDEVADRIHCSNLTTVAVTGGEPLIQQVRVAELIAHPLLKAHQWEFETAGTLVPTSLAKLKNVRFVVSPKLASSGNSEARRRNPAAIKALLAVPGTAFKFVVDGRKSFWLWETDLAEVEYLCRTWQLPPDKVWLMPCGTTPEEVATGMQQLEPIAMARGYNLSGRAQVFMHGDERGH